MLFKSRKEIAHPNSKMFQFNKKIIGSKTFHSSDFSYRRKNYAGAIIKIP